MSTGLVAGLLVAGLAGCSAEEPTTVAQAAPSASPAAVPLDESTAPAAFTGRQPLVSCGAAVGAAPDGEQLACLERAKQDGTGAELAVAETTTSATDGEQTTVTWYRVLPGGGVELFVDSTLSGFGDAGWVRASCRALATAPLSPKGCGEVEVLAG